MKKFIKLISFVMIAVLCVGSTVFAAVSGDPYKIYISSSYAETNTGATFALKLYNRSTEKSSTSYADLVNSKSEFGAANASATADKGYKYIIVDVCVKPDSNVKDVVLTSAQTAVSDYLTESRGLKKNEWNSIKFVCEYTDGDETSATYKVYSYINGKLATSTTKPIYNKTNTTRFDIRFYIRSVADNTTATADIASMSCYATNTAPGVVSSEKIINDNYVIDGSEIYVKSGIATAKALCDAVIGENEDSVQAMVMPKGKNGDSDYTNAETHILADGDTLAVRTLQTDGKNYKKTVYTINLDKTAVVLSGEAVESVEQRRINDYTRFDREKDLKVTAYAKADGKVYLAQYDADGALLSAQAQDVTAGTFASIDFAKADNMSYIKAFLWNGTSFAPLCNTQILKPVSSASTAE